MTLIHPLQGSPHSATFFLRLERWNSTSGIPRRNRWNKNIRLHVAPLLPQNFMNTCLNRDGQVSSSNNYTCKHNRECQMPLPTLKIPATQRFSELLHARTVKICCEGPESGSTLALTQFSVMLMKIIPSWNSCKPASHVAG